MQNGFPPRKQSAGLPAMNGYGSHAPSGGSSPYTQLPPSQHSRPYPQGSVQDPDLPSDNSRYGQSGSANHAPPSHALLQGYSATTMANGVNGLGISGMGHRPTTPRMSNQLDVGDPVALHLLVETALGDSEAYHVLSFDEVDRTKKELSAVTPRIESVRKKLALESKVRDAALSLIRLHHKDGSTGPPPSTRDSMAKAEEEVAQSERKCADLAQELYSLEMRQRELQTRLLMHTAGVLQMTHRGPTEKRNLSEFGHRSDMMGGAHGRPDSPESIYTYENGRADRGVHRNGHDDFDERSLYRTPDDMFTFSFDGSSKSERSLATEKQFADLGVRLDELNSKLREAIMQANAGQPAAISEANGNGEATGIASVTRQLDAIERNVGTLGGAQSPPQVLPKLQHFNKQLYGLLNAAAADGYGRRETPTPPSFEVDDAGAEIKYMESAVSTFSKMVQEMLQQAQTSRDLQERDTHERGKVEQTEKALESLWKMLITNEEEVRRRAKVTGQANAIPFDQNEAFNLPGLSKKVQWLVTQSTDLRGHADRATALEQQLTTKANEFALLESALQASRDTTAERQRTLQTLREQLVEKDNQVQAREAELSTARSQAQEQHGDLEAELVRLTTELTVAKAELDAAYGSRAERQKEANAESQVALQAAQTRVAELEAAASGVSEREKKLEEELRSTLQEFEELTKASVESEKERDKLEAAVDQLRERVEEAEASLSEEKTRWIGVGSPGSGESGAPTEATSVTTMRAEFRKMMRETRLEGVKALRAEQEKSKQLDQQLRQLRKEQMSGKSSGLRQMFSAR